MLHWLSAHHALLYWLAGASIVLFVGTLILVPIFITRIPPDYFAHPHRPAARWAPQHPAARLALSIAKNTLGCTLILVGAAMLVLPGQGLLTILIGFLMIDFPGKYRLEKWLISRRRVLAAINWFRARRGRAPLITNAAATDAPRP